MTKRNPILLAGVGIFIFALVLSAVVIPVETSSTQTVDGDTNYTLSLSFLDEFGQPMVTQPFMLVGLPGEGGVECGAILVTCSWTVTGTAIDWATFSLDLTLKVIEVLQTGDVIVHVQGQYLLTGQTGEHVFVVTEADLSSILDGLEHDLTFKVWFEGSAMDGLGNLVERSTTDQAGVRVYGQTGSMSITGTMGVDTQMNVISFSAVSAGLNPLYNPAVASLLVGVLLVATQVISLRRR